MLFKMTLMILGVGKDEKMLKAKCLMEHS